MLEQNEKCLEAKFWCVRLRAVQDNGLCSLIGVLKDNIHQALNLCKFAGAISVHGY
jgi:hypothetical protein